MALEMLPMGESDYSFLTCKFGNSGQPVLVSATASVVMFSWDSQKKSCKYQWHGGGSGSSVGSGKQQLDYLNRLHAISRGENSQSNKSVNVTPF